MQKTEKVVKDFMFDMMTKIEKIKAAFKVTDSLVAMTNINIAQKYPID